MIWYYYTRFFAKIKAGFNKAMDECRDFMSPDSRRRAPKSGAYPLCIRMRAIGNRLLVFAEKNRHILLLHHIFCVAQIAVSIRIKG